MYYTIQLVKPKVIVGMIVWDLMESATESCLSHLQHHPNVIGRIVVNNSLIHIGRNDLVRTCFEDSPDFTHLLFVDSDMTFTNDSLTSLLDANKPIISGLATMRQYPFWPAFTPRDGSARNFTPLLSSLQEETPKPLEVSGTGMAFTLIKREVLEATGKNWEKARPEFKEWFWFKRNKDGAPLGEDYTFCMRAKSKGYNSWVHPGAVIGHLGKVDYNIGDFIQVLQSEEGHLIKQEVENNAG